MTPYPTIFAGKWQAPHRHEASGAGFAQAGLFWYSETVYKTFTANDYKKLFELPADYTVDGMLCYGTWDIGRHVAFLKKILEDLGKEVAYVTLTHFLTKMIEFKVDGKRFWFDVSYGGTQLSEYLNLACLFGSKKNVLLGSCGGLSPEINSLDLIIPTYSFGNESATRMYDRASTDNRHYADKALSERLEKKINSNYKVWRGGTTTCQAMMAETLEDVPHWSQEGYLAVEMEASTVFAVSKHYNVPAAALLIVGDNLIKGETVASESYKDNKPKREEIRNDQYKVALEELLN